MYSDLFTEYCNMLVLDHYERKEDYTTCERVKKKLKVHKRLQDSDYHKLPHTTKTICKAFAKKLIDNEKWPIGEYNQ